PVGVGGEPFSRVVQAAFRQRRKQIHNGLVRELPASRESVAAALERCGLDGERRPQTLSIHEWGCLGGARRLARVLPPPASNDAASRAGGGRRRSASMNGPAWRRRSEERNDTAS